ncbi:hypothetical protein D3C73_1536520 [compost metagenome]
MAGRTSSAYRGISAAAAGFPGGGCRDDREHGDGARRADDRPGRLLTGRVLRNLAFTVFFTAGGSG